MLRARSATLLTLVAVAGCGGSGDSGGEKGEAAFDKVFEQIKDLKGEQRTRKLLQLARREGGELTLYTSLTGDTETAVADAFEDEYDIEVSVYRGTSEVVAQRVSEEARAGFRGTDAIETNGREMASLDEEDVFVPYRPEGGRGLVPEARRKSWTGTRFNTFVVSWNTRLLPAGREPRSLEELANPRWKGKIALEESDADWYRTLRDHWIEKGRSEAEADRLFEGLARNARVVSSHALMAQLLAAGEYQVAVSNYLHLAKDSIDDGAPVKFEPFVEPVVSRPQGIGLLKSAAHPASAVLFTEWLVTDGQEVLKKFNVTPARRDLVEAPGAEETFVDVNSFVEEADRWTDGYEGLLRLGEKIEGGE